MAYATNESLMDLVGTTIFDHGVEDFTDELTKAEADVKRYIEVNWFNKALGSRAGRVASLGNTFDATLLTDSQWEHSTVFLAMYRYILPRLSPFRGDDAFSNQISFYRQRFNEEITEEMAKGVEYDINDDGTIQEGEKYQKPNDRIYR